MAVKVKEKARKEAPVVQLQAELPSATSRPANLKMFLADQKELLIFARRKEISVYCLRTKNFVTSAISDDGHLILSVAANDDCETAFVVTEKNLLEYTLPHLKLQKSTPLSERLGSPKVTLATHAAMGVGATGTVDRFLVVQEGGETLWARRSKDGGSARRFGKIGEYCGNPLFSHNDESLCVVSDDNYLKIFPMYVEDSKIVHRLPRRFPTTCVSMSPSSTTVACGDVAGKILLCQPSSSSSDGSETRMIVRKMHWHALPVRCLGWSPDGEHLFSGGGESVLVKWGTVHMNKEEVAPRLGGAIVDLIVTGISVVVVLEDLTTKCFTHHLRLTSHVSAFVDSGAIEVCRSGAQWHLPTASAAYLRGASNNSLSFYDPRARKDVLSLEISPENLTFGDWRRPGEGDKNESEEEKEEGLLFSFSDSGRWLITTGREATARIWSFSQIDKNFRLSAELLRCHEDAFVGVSIHEMSNDGVLAITASTDGRIKVWGCNDGGTSWHLQKIVCYKGLTPQCFATSADMSVLAIGFPSSVTLWSVARRFELRASLQMDSNKYSDPVSLAFWRDRSNHHVCCLTKECVVIFNCISLEITCRIDVPSSSARVSMHLRLRALENNTVAFTSHDGDVHELSQDFRLKSLHSNVNSAALDVFGDGYGNIYAATDDGRVILLSSQLRGKGAAVAADSLAKPVSHGGSMDIFGGGKETQRIVKPPVQGSRHNDRLDGIEVSMPVSRSVLAIVKQAV